jgi:hypothetical protein
MQLVEPVVDVLAIGPAGGADFGQPAGGGVASSRRHRPGYWRVHCFDLRQRNRASATSASICFRSCSASPARERGNVSAAPAA